jgi:hypothetical protein
MAKNARAGSPGKKGRPETEVAVPLEEPPLSDVIPLPPRPGSQGPEVWVAVGPEGEGIVAEALARVGGLDAVTRQLAGIDLPALVGPSALREETYVRPQDLELIAEALRNGSGPDVLTLLLAQAAVHAVVSGTLGPLTQRSRVTARSFKCLREKYRKCHKTRTRNKEHRRERVQELLDEVGNNPKRIWGELSRQYGIEVDLKTVYKDISSIRKA